MTAVAPAAADAAGSELERDVERASSSTPAPVLARPALVTQRAPGVLRAFEVVGRAATGAVVFREPHAFQFTGRSGVSADALARMLAVHARAQAIEQALWDALDWPVSGC